MNSTVPTLIRPNRCEKCHWSSALPGQQMLECRRYPPATNHVLNRPGAGPPVQPISYFPIVRNDQFCGEFKAGLAA